MSRRCWIMLEMSHHPIPKETCHHTEVIPPGEAVIRSGKDVQAFVSLERLKKTLALVQRDELVAVTLYDEGRRLDRFGGVVPIVPQRVLVECGRQSNASSPTGHIRN